MMIQHRIGCALPFGMLHGPAGGEVLTALENAFGSSEALLKSLAEAGVNTVELRAVSSGHEPEQVMTAAQRCHAAGLGITIHGSLRENEEAETFYTPYLSLFSSGLQEEYNITLHSLAVREATEKALTELCRMADEKEYPVHFTLENNRRKGEIKCGDNTAEIGDIVRTMALPRLSACWDFGHFYYNLHHFTDDTTVLPPEVFLCHAGHTHIHGIMHDRTHFPLDRADIPLEKYCRALLTHGYTGIFSLELDFPRFFGEIDLREALDNSISVLKGVVRENG